jgi:endonuclease YncB( thermonuclease family)
VAVQWVTVAVLLALVVAIQIFKPGWTGIEVGKPAPKQPGQRGGDYHAIDGDSFRAGDVEIRLHGIDAPEFRQTCKDKAGKAFTCGKSARDALSKLISTKSVACTIIDRDRYGRQVSVCRDGKLDINREMVRLGWAVAYRRHAMGYVSAEREAKAALRGIWAGSFELPEDYRKRATRGSLAGDD